MKQATPYRGILEQNLMFYDIETVPVVYHYEDLDDELRNARDKKYSKQKPDTQSMQDFWLSKAPFFAEFGKIVSIGVLQPKLEAVSGKVGYISSALKGTEAEILRKFVGLINKYSPQLVGRNNKGFDNPYTIKRLVANGIMLPEMYDPFNKKPRELQGIDLMEVFRFGERVNSGLNVACAMLGVPTPKDYIDGSKVAEWYHVYGKVDDIHEYCVKDVIATWEVYKKIYAVSPGLQKFRP